MKLPIRCKVAQILSDTELVITAGSSDGVTEGMGFAVMGKLSIRDPDDPSRLMETIPVVKIMVKAATIGEKVSVARTYKITPDFDIASPLFLRQERLASDQVTQSTDWDRIVRVGDEVIQRIADM